LLAVPLAVGPAAEPGMPPHELLNPFAIPVVLVFLASADEPLGGEAPDPFQRVQIIVVAGLPVFGVEDESRLTTEPGQAVAHAPGMFVVAIRSATLNCLTRQRRRAALQLTGGDDDRRDAGARHTAVAAVPFLDVAPGTVVVLRAGEVRQRPLPGLPRDR